MKIKAIMFVQYKKVKERDKLKVVVSNHTELPIYMQIKDQIKEQILNGTLKENETLPSIRQLAKDIGISVITTTRAYSELEQEGFIATTPGKGSIILPRDNAMVREQYLKRIEEAFLLAMENARYAGIDKEELVVILKTLLEV
ncbi:GntR family transcriptional regulator [Anaerocolumna sp. AGMB13025]|uniref:GntR family transcriptional regulator n=1 Tax=Anaerocolumna sp. AGMB13025 TaxID=3039116 RepID=UPI002F41FE6C